MKMLMMQKVVLVICLTASLPIGSRLGAATFSVSGHATFSRTSFINGIHQEPYIDEHYAFYAESEGELWFIRYEHEHVLTKGDYVEMAYNGKHVYAYQSLETWAKDQLAAGNQIASNLFHGSVYNGKVPCVHLHHYAGIVWLAFCSSAFFADNKDPEITPAAVYCVGKSGAIDPLDDYTTRYRCRLPNRTYSGPLEVLYYGKPHNAFPDGYTNTIFQGLSFTNVNGIHIPLEAQMYTYRPYRKPGEYTTNLLLCAKYSLVVTNISFNVPKRLDYRPAFRGVAAIGDLRYHGNKKYNVDAVPYIGTKWLDESEVKKLPQFSQRLKEKAKFERHATNTSLIIVGFLLVLAVPFIVAGFRMFVKKEN